MGENILGKWPGFHTPPSAAGFYKHVGIESHPGIRGVRLAVSTHAGCVSVEHGRVDGVVGKAVIVHVLFVGC